MVQTTRRLLLAGAAGSLAHPWIGRASAQGSAGGELKLGQTQPYSGPASAFGHVGRANVAYFAMVNDAGGVGGRRVNLISLDDGYSPPRTVEQTRRLVEQDEVTAIFASLGTAPNMAIIRYLNQRRIPHLFVASGASAWGNTKLYPYTTGSQPTYRMEAQIYGKYILANVPNPKIGVIFQNDDYGKDYVLGLKDALGDRYGSLVVREVSYEVTDPTIDSQVLSMQTAGANAIISGISPKFAAMLIRKAFELDWHPLHCMSNTSASVTAVMRPAGPERGVGIISAAYAKDPLDPTWANDEGMATYRAFMKRWMPDADPGDASYVVGYAGAFMMHRVLQQCGTDFSRENIMRQVNDLHPFTCGVLQPGMALSMTSTEHVPMRQLTLMKWTGTTWSLFGKPIEAT